MFEQTELAGQFEALLAKEQAAAGVYEGMARNCPDPARRQQLEALQREKLRHVELTQRLLEIVEA